ncbi:MAG: endonuclease-3 [Hyphomicrobiaceae bacterium]|jgi:endonuclease-3
MRRVLRRLRAARKTSDAPVTAFVAQMEGDPFRVLASCILSLRTKDETTVPASLRLFELAPDLPSLARAKVSDVEKAIYPVGFYRTKAPKLVAMAARIISEFGGVIPDDIETLMLLDGVGPKTANLVVTCGYGKLGICVDIHVHRIANRWGYVTTSTPEKTEQALRSRLPKRYWIEFNDLLVSWGQTVCRPVSPFCSQCNISQLCARIGVTSSR